MMKMGSRVLAVLAASLVSVVVVGCNGSGSSEESAPADVGPSTENDLTSGSGIMCDGLGTNDPELMQEQGTKLTITQRGGNVQQADKIADPAPGFFGYRLTDSTVWLSHDGTKAQLHEDNVGPFWDSTCHKATPSEISVDACALSLRDMGVGSKKPTVDKLSDTSYKLTSTSATTGDYVWSVKTKGTGFSCNVVSLKAVSCSAIVYDKIGAKARDDGSSSGSPYVNKGHTGFTWSGGIHDVESGDFAYAITTSSFDDNCKVTAITSTTN